ncbi:hypothetical protein [Paraburkholderia unamae]|uniref:Uncharacterized protein n=1 Tax=Paraburkholderia unamae TaxID=219649 RepID=A0ABX5K898_9BURK|nr:hypothetical protein [Paraburkholderia unamae]PVX61030.1 hypothetical protein C7402_1468 [Paraburkholderia unamae]
MQEKSISHARDGRRSPTQFAHEHEGPSWGKRADHEKANREKTETQNRTQAERRPLSPYTIHNLDTAIAHLEVAMNADQSMELFGENYWHSRVLELRSTPGILHAQDRRLQCLLDRFGGTG